MTKPAGENFRELKPGTFVYALDNALDSDTCKSMIERFELNSDQRHPGRIGQQAEQEESIKRSTDLRISGREDWRDIDEILKQSLAHGLGLLSGLHPFFQANKLHDVGYNMQKTDPGEYYHWHVDGGPGQFSKRQLVAIWYLNNFSQNGGETEFFFQELSIRPDPGLLILFPPFWTHLHRGKLVLEGEKYIATTWVCCD